MTGERKNAAGGNQRRDAEDDVVRNITCLHGTITETALQEGTDDYFSDELEGVEGVVVALARARRAIVAAYALGLLELARRRGGCGYGE